VIAQHHDPRPGQWLSGQLKAPQKLIILPATVTDDEPDALFRWFDLMIQQMLKVAT
jgi:hypothetical protein